MANEDKSACSCRWRHQLSLQKRKPDRFLVLAFLVTIMLASGKKLAEAFPMLHPIQNSRSVPIRTQ